MNFIIGFLSHVMRKARVSALELVWLDIDISTM
jgi:hypothetical protein